ncbi:uncharacterized protein F4812DRAFT_44130 [Daldinia caldariorum]|uniref:uncharacterized protein n=1 Tax=Daldinia caldariorum TaxID=326644 RepID=UPI002007E3B8|nr:uncharacterized protein F4812DRAFT_44130 [Daldinia caldariorum]KAI1473256.1 hypothetical protein F4812DRAFT_44130 [Daldinia caldariorum]
MPGVTAASVTSVRRGSREPREVAAVRSYQQLAGCILWLPAKTELREDCGSDIEADRCNHPVVILSPQAEDGKVTYLMITSLKGTELKTRFKRDQNLRLEHIPIRPNDPHPDNGMLLSLEDVALALRKKSYVKTKTQYRIRVASLRPYERRGPEYILSRKSYQDLIDYSKFTPPAPHPSQSTVSSPGRVWSYGQAIPIARERSGSYSEYVSAQRHLESAAVSPPRLHYVPTANTNLSRYTRTAVRGERDPLLAQSYSRGSYSSYPGSYSNSHPAYTYGTSGRAGYQSSTPTVRFDAEGGWKKIKILFWTLFGISAALIGAYGAYRGVTWLTDVGKHAGSMVKGEIEEVGNKIGDLWSSLVKLGTP